MKSLTIKYIRSFGNMTIYFFNDINSLNKTLLQLINLDLLHSVSVKIEVPDFDEFNHFYYNTALQNNKRKSYLNLFLQYKYILVVNFSTGELERIEKKLIKKECV